MLGIDGDCLTLEGGVEDVLRAADTSHDVFLQAADRLADTPSRRHEFVDGWIRQPPGQLVFDTRPALNLREENIRSIVWANGFGFNLDWVGLPILDGRGAPVQRRGVTACPGVFFLGLHWMHTFRSAILTFVERDACYIADQIDLASSKTARSARSA